jgi:hypothetical protein
VWMRWKGVEVDDGVAEVMVPLSCVVEHGTREDGPVSDCLLEQMGCRRVSSSDEKDASDAISLLPRRVLRGKLELIPPAHTIRRSRTTWRQPHHDRAEIVLDVVSAVSRRVSRT